MYHLCKLQAGNYVILRSIDSEYFTLFNKSTLLKVKNWGCFTI